MNSVVIHGSLGAWERQETCVEAQTLNGTGEYYGGVISASGLELSRNSTNIPGRVGVGLRER